VVQNVAFLIIVSVAVGPATQFPDKVKVANSRAPKQGLQ
jgi:hypothetical protein